MFSAKSRKMKTVKLDTNVNLRKLQAEFIKHLAGCVVCLSKDPKKGEDYPYRLCENGFVIVKDFLKK